MESSTPLTFTHLRFQARACTPIRLGQYQGAERLRDALAQAMLRAVIPDPSTGSSGPRNPLGGGVPLQGHPLRVAASDVGNLRLVERW